MHVRRKPALATGFTLIEIMIVVVILSVLAALVVPSMMGKAGDARQVAAVSDIRTIVTALEMYRLENFTYPSTDQGLKALVKKPSGYPPAPNWNPNGYLRKLPIDPWGKAYLYISPGTDGEFTLLTLGSDGRAGGSGEAKDINFSDL
ncbi:type II secretion system major pseudopilin GspG [SAR92 clade bacterium H231]|nr:type II secretion system major pseudopilin GspG [SAR92 clade bacterium H231]